jgi:hypothetical protein
VDVVLQSLEKNPLPMHKQPAFPNYHKPAAVTPAATR